MGRRCRHPIRFRIYTRNPARMTLECGSCRAWLPLGPARHTPEVEVEIRAAEIAAMGTHGEHGDRRDCAACGWLAAAVGGFDTFPPGPKWLAGYLARCIATHGDDQ